MGLLLIMQSKLLWAVELITGICSLPKISSEASVNKKKRARVALLCRCIAQQTPPPSDNITITILIHKAHCGEDANIKINPLNRSTDGIRINPDKRIKELVSLSLTLPRKNNNCVP